MKKKNVVLCQIILFACILITAACKKNIISEILNPQSVIPQSPVNPGYSRYTIQAGLQFATGTEYLLENVSTTDLHFKVIFDSTAIYTTTNPEDQDDINKLYGFADNNDNDHHLYSARFGWNWRNGALWLYGYIYNNGVETSTKLDSIPLGQPADCSIKVQGNQYLFVLNGVTTTMPRASTTATGEGYKLFPYFGGVENAPHTINIDIDEISE